MLPKIKLPTAGKAGNYSFHLPVPLVYPVPRTVRMLFLIKLAAEASARKMEWYFQKQQKIMTFLSVEQMVVGCIG